MDDLPQHLRIHVAGHSRRQPFHQRYDVYAHDPLLRELDLADTYITRAGNGRCKCTQGRQSAFNDGLVTAEHQRQCALGCSDIAAANRHGEGSAAALRQNCGNTSRQRRAQRAAGGEYRSGLQRVDDAVRSRHPLIGLRRIGHQTGDEITVPGGVRCASTRSRTCARQFINSIRAHFKNSQVKTGFYQE